jgi:hypothetical protein
MPSPSRASSRAFGPGRALLLAALGVAFGTSPSQGILIANGLAPPNPANVIDASNSFPGTEPVRVQNVGCDFDTDFGNCDSPGAPTTVAVVEGAVVGGELSVHETSRIDLSGGTVAGPLLAFGDATLTISGGLVSDFFEALGGDIVMTDGTLEGNVSVYLHGEMTISGGTILGAIFSGDIAHVTIEGGTIGGRIEARDLAGERITVVGSQFAVDGIPVPYGPIAAMEGTLTGLLASGDPIDVAFARDYSYTLIELAPGVPEPSTALLLGSAAVGLMAR